MIDGGIVVAADETVENDMIFCLRPTLWARSLISGRTRRLYAAATARKLPALPVVEGALKNAQRIALADACQQDSGTNYARLLASSYTLSRMRAFRARPAD